MMPVKDNLIRWFFVTFGTWGMKKHVVPDGYRTRPADVLDDVRQRVGDPKGHGEVSRENNSVAAVQ